MVLTIMLHRYIGELVTSGRHRIQRTKRPALLTLLLEQLYAICFLYLALTISWFSTCLTPSVLRAICNAAVGLGLCFDLALKRDGDIDGIDINKRALDRRSFE